MMVVVVCGNKVSLFHQSSVYMYIFHFLLPFLFLGLLIKL